MFGPLPARVVLLAWMVACAPRLEAPPPDAARGGGPAALPAESDAGAVAVAVPGVPLRFVRWGALTWEGPAGAVPLAEEVVGPPACRGAHCAWVARVGPARTGTLFVAVVGADAAPTPAAWGPVGEADRLVWSADGAALYYVAPRAGRATLHRWSRGAPAPEPLDAPVPRDTPRVAADGSLAYDGPAGPVRLAPAPVGAR